MQFLRELFGEKYLSHLTAVFGDEAQAREAADDLRRHPAMERVQVSMIAPGESRPTSKVEPETRGIWRTAWKSHLILGVLGLFLGIILAKLLLATGAAFATSSPNVLAAVLAFFGLSGGMILAGLLTLRPDQDRLVGAARAAAEEGKWTVVAHVKNAEEKEAAREMLSQRRAQVNASL